MEHAYGLAGYFAWSFGAFTLTEKPRWEFLVLYTALYLIVKRSVEAAALLPPRSFHAETERA